MTGKTSVIEAGFVQEKITATPLRAFCTGKIRRFAISSSLSGVLLAVMLGSSGCNASQVLTHGSVVSQDQFDLIPVGNRTDAIAKAW